MIEVKNPTREELEARPRRCYFVKFPGEERLRIAHLNERRLGEVYVDGSIDCGLFFVKGLVVDPESPEFVLMEVAPVQWAPYMVGLDENL